MLRYEVLLAGGASKAAKKTRSSLSGMARRARGLERNLAKETMFSVRGP